MYFVSSTIDLAFNYFPTNQFVSHTLERNECKIAFIKQFENKPLGAYLLQVILNRRNLKVECLLLIKKETTQQGSWC